MNNYGGLDLVKVRGNRTSAVDDDNYMSLMEASSRAVDRVAGRRFYATIETRYLDPSHPKRLWLTDDLVSVTTLAVDQDNDGVYETTLTTSDYFLWPSHAAARGEPYRAIDLNPNSTNLTAWPLVARAVRLAGMWGYSYELEAAGALDGALSDTTGVTVTLAAGHTVQRGDTIVVGSEQMWVSGTPSSPQLTVTRGVNGSTAATHADATAVYRRRYPREIETAVGMQAQRLFQAMRTGGGAGLAGEGLGFQFGELWPAIRDFIGPYVVRTL